MPSKNLGALSPLWRFLRPYLPQLVGAGFFLLVAAATVLGLGWALRHLIDDGLAGGNAALLDRTVVALLGVVVEVSPCLSEMRGGRGDSVFDAE